MNELMVKRRHRYNGECENIYKGSADVCINNERCEIIYKEYDEVTQLIVDTDNALLIRETPTSFTKLVFNDKNSFGIVRNEFGVINLNLKLIKLSLDEHGVVIIYDLVDSANNDGYILEFKLEVQ